MNRLQTRTCHRAPRHAGSARSGNADGGGGAGNADGGGDAGGRGWKVRPTRLDEAHERSYDENAHARAVGARGQRATERGAFCEGFTRRRERIAVVRAVSSF